MNYTSHWFRESEFPTWSEFCPMLSRFVKFPSNPCQALSASVKSCQSWSNLGQISSNVLSNIVKHSAKCCWIVSNVIKHYQILSNVLSKIVKCSQALWNPADCCQVLSNILSSIVKSCHSLSNIVKFCPISCQTLSSFVKGGGIMSSVVWSCQMLSSSVQYCQILANLAMLLSNFVKSCHSPCHFLWNHVKFSQLL